VSVPALITGHEPGTPLWWVDRLATQLRERRPGIEKADAYYRGDHPLVFASEKFRIAFGGLFGGFADNWCELVVDAVEERLNVEGFRFGDDRKGDRDAWAIWQRNGLDADSQIAHTEMLVCREAYALVWADDDGQAEVTIEHPSQTIVAYQAGSLRKRAAGLKLWTDDDGTELATLYLPDAIYKFRGSRRIWGADAVTTSYLSQWTPRQTRGEKWPLPNPLGVVPLVPLRNRPRLLADPVSEIARVIPLQDAINKTVADMLVASEYGAFRQRWATGLEIPVDPTTKELVEPFSAAVDRVWTNENPNGKFGDFAETSLENFVKAIELLVQHIASQTRTPPHYFALGGQFPSGESIKSAETGLVAKVRRKMRHVGESWEEVMRLCFAIEGDDRAEVTAAETIWADPESRSEAQHVDALTKLRSIGVPDEQLWEDAGYSPQQIERFKTMQSGASERASAGDLAALSLDGFTVPPQITPPSEQ
jgi:hypothetical protein